MTPSIKVTYFNIRGLGEPLRLLLKYGNIDFEDNRITHETWTTLKPTTPFGQLPLYEEDGKSTAQSVATCRYIAKKVKLTGANDWEDLEIDAIVDTVTDFRIKIVSYAFEKDEARKEKLKETFVNETVPFYLERLDKIAGENGGYLATGKLTWADIYFYHISDFLPMFFGAEGLSKYPNLLKVRENVLKIPSVKNWIDTRPKTDH